MGKQEGKAKGRGRIVGTGKLLSGLCLPPCITRERSRETRSPFDPQETFHQIEMGEETNELGYRIFRDGEEEE